jgi:hypothetical protein
MRETGNNSQEWAKVLMRHHDRDTGMAPENETPGPKPVG